MIAQGHSAGEPDWLRTHPNYRLERILFVLEASDYVNNQYGMNNLRQHDEVNGVNHPFPFIPHHRRNPRYRQRRE